MEIPVSSLVVLSRKVLPRVPESTIIYRLIPKYTDLSFYYERTDRNIGWITHDEQDILRSSVVGIAGTGGMGGLLASTLLRAGVGEIRIADCEMFDASNINRQFAATRSTIGKSKAFETARFLRGISDDTTIAVYPQGITEDTVSHFIDGCSIICDEIEALSVDSRILLHASARSLGVSLFNCNTIGFSTNLFLYTPKGMTMEETLGMTYDSAKKLKSRAENGDMAALREIIDTIIRAVAPEIPEYRSSKKETDINAFYRRLTQEGKVSIIATNPPVATGFLANHVLLYLLRNSGVSRHIAEIPPMPGYLHLDTAQIKGFSRTGAWY